MDVAEASLLWQVAHKLGVFLHFALHADGLNIYTAAGKEAGQEVFHTHIHLLPRFDTTIHKGKDHTTFAQFSQATSSEKQQQKPLSPQTPIYSSQEERRTLAKDLRRFSLASPKLNLSG